MAKKKGKIKDKKGKTQAKNKVPSKRWEKYKDGKKAPTCPKCGPAIFLAQHKDRQYCGSCHYMEKNSK